MLESVPVGFDLGAREGLAPVKYILYRCVGDLRKMTTRSTHANLCLRLGISQVILGEDDGGVLSNIVINLL
jgi:hypothetical protein